MQSDFLKPKMFKCNNINYPQLPWENSTFSHNGNSFLRLEAL